MNGSVLAIRVLHYTLGGDERPKGVVHEYPSW
jgi:hypothetical protein